MQQPILQSENVSHFVGIIPTAQLSVSVEAMPWQIAPVFVTGQQFHDKSPANVIELLSHPIVGSFNPIILQLLDAQLPETKGSAQIE